ncbi:hypothetical protein PAXINDRAFT_179568 [Paxillus involutus ATCC 200175]|nr:hypothetical protein PAXINDRAFT_179568 [Paxillus involutus ATCC 200175]
MNTVTSVPVNSNNCGSASCGCSTNTSKVWMVLINVRVGRLRMLTWKLKKTTGYMNIRVVTLERWTLYDMASGLARIQGEDAFAKCHTQYTRATKKSGAPY